MDTGLRDLVFLVTGAAGGIGSAVARLLAAEGARPVLHCHRSRDGADALARELGGAPVVQADLTSEEQVDTAFAAAGPLDGVVANAGVWVERPTPVHRMTLGQWRATLDADLTSAFLTCRAFLRQLAEAPRPDPALVLVGSTAALFGEEGHADYAAAKAGLVHGLLPSLKNELVRLAPRGRANAVCPGWTATPMAAGALADDDAVARALSTVADRRVATAEEVAHAVVYLCSPRLAAHVTGAVLPMHGGMEGRVLHPPE